MLCPTLRDTMHHAKFDTQLHVNYFTPVEGLRCSRVAVFDLGTIDALSRYLECVRKCYMTLYVGPASTQWLTYVRV
jgi:hypothetical protein